MRNYSLKIALLTALIALVTAIVVLLTEGIKLGREFLLPTPPTVVVTATVLQPTALVQTRTLMPTITEMPTPLPQAIAIITPRKGAVVKVKADSLVYRHLVRIEGLPLANGVRLPFSKMRGFVVKLDSADDPKRVTVTITLLSGETVVEDLIEIGNLEGSTELGPFLLTITEVKQVEFQR